MLGRTAVEIKSWFVIVAMCFHQGWKIRLEQVHKSTMGKEISPE